MNPTEVLLLVAAGLVAGGLNSVAGGGTFVSFPAAVLWAALPEREAAATSTLALAPGALAAAWGYRGLVHEQRRSCWRLLGPACAGGLAGAVLLDGLDGRVFQRLVPWMVLGGALLILAQERLARRSVSSSPPGQSPELLGQLRWGLVAVAVLGIATYGGYFGAGGSILLLAVLCSGLGLDVLAGNAVKTVLIGALNLVAALYFVAQGLADLQVALPLGAGAILGGFTGARGAQRLPRAQVRQLVAAVGVTLSALLAYRQWHS